MKFYTLYILLFCFCLFTGTALAQSVDLKFVQIANSGVENGFYEVKVQIAGSVAYNQGDFNIRFNYNALGLNTPTLGNTYNFTSGPYDPITITTIGNRVNINGNFNSGTASEVAAAPAWVDVASIRFKITDPIQTTQFVFRNSSATSAPTVLFTDNSNQLQTRSLSNLDAPLSNNNSLPVTLTSFAATLHKDKVHLKWATASEENNEKFIVERSANGLQFQEITSVKGAGSTHEMQKYEAFDPAPLAGLNYYRLKQVDLDGAAEYSAIIPVKVNEAAKAFAIKSVYPNPIKNNSAIYFSAKPESVVEVTLSTLQGNTVFQKRVVTTGQQNSFSFNTIDNLQSGIYMVQVKCENEVAAYKVIKE